MYLIVVMLGRSLVNIMSLFLSVCLFLFFFFFFFQAEDGIRDKLVTGVQTCALPISLSAADGRRAHIVPRSTSCILARDGRCSAASARVHSGRARPLRDDRRHPCGTPPALVFG